MFCVIQEIKTHKPSTGKPKRIETHEFKWTSNGVTYYEYKWHYSDERFERPLKPSYRISIHQSYRENGKVKKKQLVICTMQYYSIIDWGSWIGDYVTGGLKEKADILEISEDELSDMVYEKFQPIVDKIKEEYKKTDEYAAKQEHRKLIDEYEHRKSEFAKEYEIDRDEYEKCYDIFGELRNPDYLEKIKREYKERKEYEKKSRSYQEDFYSNYSKYFGGGSSSYFNSVSDKHTDEDKEILKQFYRVLSKKFHPDANPDIDTSKEMRLLNRLKSEWGV